MVWTSPIWGHPIFKKNVSNLQKQGGHSAFHRSIGIKICWERTKPHSCEADPLKNLVWPMTSQLRVQYFFCNLNVQNHFSIRVFSMFSNVTISKWGHCMCFIDSNFSSCASVHCQRLSPLQKPSGPTPSGRKMSIKLRWSWTWNRGEWRCDSSNRRIRHLLLITFAGGSPWTSPTSYNIHVYTYMWFMCLW